MYDYILVLDFGSQYNMLICRRLRELGVFSELKPYNTSIDEIKKIKNLKGIVLSGGPNSVYSKDSFDIDPEIFSLGVPILGICYGLQIICHKLGGSIVASSEREYGKALLDFTNKGLLFDSIDDKPTVWMSHGDKVTSIPDGFSVTASTPTCQFAGIEDTKRKIYGVQFHPEVRNTVDGYKILSNFIYKICNARNNWKMENYVSMVIDDVRKEVGDKRVLLGLSGGVDSSVVAALLHKAIGKQLTCMFIDNGLLRKNEGDEVVKTFKETFDMDVVRIDAKDLFLNDLKGLTDPEAKRKAIGAQFVYTFDRECKKIGQFDFLAQGTLYTDVIESGTATAQTIKSHHNVGGLPKDIKFKLIEPLRVLFKDEVRSLGLVLGLPHNVVWRQPFPGPGLGIRVLGEVTEEKIKIVQDTDYILREEIKKNNLEGEIWQYFTVLPNVQSVGVMGDQRTYSHTIVIRAITSVDGMTGDWARIPYDVLDTISRRIVNECDDVNRVVYDCTSKPPATIEWE